MGSYDNIVKTEEIRKNIEAGDYLSAQKILDTIELKKIKHVSDLNLFAEVYRENERYDEAAGLYRRVYDKVRTRKALGQLVYVYIRKGSTEEAENYLSEYLKASPEDFDAYIFRYKIEKLKGASYEKLIEILQQLKKLEYNEQWAYELAKVYYKAGMEPECIRECSDIILWFGEGIYVEKARMLRSYYSGETDKERIMEELKRRSEQAEGNLGTADSLREDSEALEENPAKTEYISEEDEGELEYDLKKDIQDILLQEEQQITEETTEDEDSEEREELQEAEQEVEQKTEQGIGQEVEQETEQDIEQEVEQETEQDIEQEAELQALKMLENQNLSEDYSENMKLQSDPENAVEEILDEDDVKLQQVAEKYGIVTREIFGNFLHVPMIKKQIVKSIEQIAQDSKKPVIMIITGTKGSGKTTLAKDIALFLSKTDRLKTAKLAKITAEKLNTVDLDSKRETLRSCCMVVENASELKHQTIEGLLSLMKQLQGDIAVVFEEDKKNMNRLFRESPKLMDILKIRIHLPQYTPEDMLGFAKACLEQKDYYLEQKVENILKNKLNQIMKQSEPQTYLAQIYNLMQSVMNAADLRMGKQLTDLAAKGRLKEVGILTVIPEDFNC